MTDKDNKDEKCRYFTKFIALVDLYLAPFGVFAG